MTSDGGVSRGLGLSVNGQRPSASNYLLDGVENNNYLTTGPLTPIAPEAIQEYRVSVSNYSAQYGRTSGFIANAVTKAGTEQWHGVAYFYFRNAALDANSFTRNLEGLGTPLDREAAAGISSGWSAASQPAVSIDGVRTFRRPPGTGSRRRITSQRRLWSPRFLREAWERTCSQNFPVRWARFRIRSRVLSPRRPAVMHHDIVGAVSLNQDVWIAAPRLHHVRTKSITSPAAARSRC